jgi:hypothetical protein
MQRLYHLRIDRQTRMETALEVQALAFALVRCGTARVSDID